MFVKDLVGRKSRVWTQRQQDLSMYQEQLSERGYLLPFGILTFGHPGYWV